MMNDPTRTKPIKILDAMRTSMVGWMLDGFQADEAVKRGRSGH
jgi:hypothetical protein